MADSDMNRISNIMRTLMDEENDFEEAAFSLMLASTAKALGPQKPQQTAQKAPETDPAPQPKAQENAPEEKPGLQSIATWYGDTPEEKAERHRQQMIMRAMNKRAEFLAKYGPKEHYQGA